MKRFLLSAALILAAAMLPAAAHADGEAEFDYHIATASGAAAMLRAEADSEPCRYWLTAYGHAVTLYPQKKAVVAMLKSAAGVTDDAVPVGLSGLKLQPCCEVPLPVEGEKFQRDVDFNLHGTIYSDSPIVSVTASFAPRGTGKGETQTVTFDPAADVRAYSLVSEENTLEGKSLDTLVDVSKLVVGRYDFTLTAATAANAGPVTLYSAQITVEKNFPYNLTQNKFDDNYSEALTFFQGDTSKFMFTYSFRDERSISTQTVWREASLVECSFKDRVHKDALPYFEKAYEYTQTSYVRMTSVLKNGKMRYSKVIPLYTLIDKISTYVPRFQSNMEYVSHHTLGTAADVNDNMYPNFNIITNHDLIGDDVKNNLTYNGIMTDDKGQQYYDFTYKGSYKAFYKNFPKTVLNYLLYELAFYRAGFQWGYYYETACDGMHFMLSENDINRFLHSDIGLRKVYEYYN